MHLHVQLQFSSQTRQRFVVLLQFCHLQLPMASLKHGTSQQRRTLSNLTFASAATVACAAAASRSLASSSLRTKNSRCFSSSAIRASLQIDQPMQTRISAAHTWPQGFRKGSQAFSHAALVQLARASLVFARPAPALAHDASNHSSQTRAPLQARTHERFQLETPAILHSRSERAFFTTVNKFLRTCNSFINAFARSISGGRC
jgi:hypothetical protein